MSTVLPILAVVFLVCLSCESIGARLVTSKQPLVALVAGWSVFLALCWVPWLAGFSANAARPLFWIFYVVGGWFVIRGRQWKELAVTAVVTAAVGLVLLHRCYGHDGAMAFGAHGTDMWGYVGVAEWLYEHSTHQLPDLVTTPMRFNWTWYVLTVRDRPLIYEAMACLGASTGIDAVKAYMAWPVALMATVVIGVGRIPGAFGFRGGLLALLPAGLMVFNPIPVLHWIAGFAAGTIVGLLVGLAFAAVAVAEKGAARTEALALAVLLAVFCGGLYSPQFMLVGVGLAGALALVGGVFKWKQQGWAGLTRARPGWRTLGSLGVAAGLAVATKLRSGDDFIPTTGWDYNGEAWAQLLGIFGGLSPYARLYYAPMTEGDQHPLANPVGLVGLVLMAGMFGQVAWREWRAARDLRVLCMVGICLAALFRVGGDDRAAMVKAMPIFGLTLVILLAAISAQVRPRWLGLVAALLCAMPAVRSHAELREMICDPYITCTDQNIALNLADGQNWRIMGYLYFREDSHGYDWSQNPKIFSSMTCFLPKADQERLARKYHLPLP